MKMAKNLRSFKKNVTVISCILKYVAKSYDNMNTLCGMFVVNILSVMFIFIYFVVGEL
jgi:hypothetical protein